MEMHYNAVVVSLTDEKKKAFREVDAKKTKDGRRCSVFMPFDTEYKLLVKNINKERRIRLEIDIDGTNVSGTGLVMDANDSAYIERFVDIAKKFKFVKAMGEGANEDVADPTNPENGIIKVRVYTEKKADPKPLVIEKHHHHHDHWPWGYPHQPLTWTSQNASYNTSSGSAPQKRSLTRGFSSTNEPEMKSGGGVVLPSTDNTLSFNCHVDSMIPSHEPQNVNYSQESIAGATVEGNRSSQHFGKTMWEGDDGLPIVFSFQLIGTPAQDKLEDDPEYQEWLRLQEKFGKTA
jgi:hypothetical protein